MENLDIRFIVTSSGLTYKAVAQEIGISRYYLSRIMRKPLSPNNRIRILTAIDRLKAREEMKNEQR